MIQALLAILVVLLAAAPPGDIATRVERGKMLLAGQRYDEAIVEFKAVLEQDPMNGTALFNLGHIYGSYMGDEKLREHYWKHYKAASYLSLIEVFIEEGDLQKAVAQYEKALATLPGNGLLHEQLGELYRRMGMEEEALREYRIASDLEPKKLRLQVALWHYLAGKGRSAEAANYLERAVALRPRDGKLRRMARSFYERLGETDKAMEQLVALSDAGKASAGEHCQLGDLCVKRGLLDRAARELRLGLSGGARDDCFQSARKLGKAYEDKGEVGRAGEVYRAMLDAGCRDPDIHNSLLLVRRKQGKLDAAVVAAEKGLVSYPGNASLRNNLATLYALRKEYERAVTEYRKAVELDPALAGAYLDMGIIYKEYLGEREKAVEAFRRYVELKPEGRNIPEVADLLGPPEDKAAEGVPDKAESVIAPQK